MNHVYSMNTVNGLSKRSQQKIAVLHSYVEENHLSVNVDNIKVICFRTGGFNTNFKFYFDRMKIELVNTIKYLGVYFQRLQERLKLVVRQQNKQWVQYRK